MLGRFRMVVAVPLAAAALLFAVSASAGGGVTGGDFETGDLTGWTVANTGSGNWFTYSRNSPLNDFDLANPPKNNFAAVTDQDAPGAHVLYRQLELGRKARNLSFFHYYRNRATVFCTPATLDPGAGCNQQYRVDILRKGADPFSVAPGDILMTLCRTEVGDPLTIAPTKMQFSLAGLKGTVILRFAEVDNLGIFNASVDDVKLQDASSTPAF